MVEDNAKDVELTLTALEEYNLANEVVVVRDGAGGRALSLYRGAWLIKLCAVSGLPSVRRHMTTRWRGMVSRNDRGLPTPSAWRPAIG
jgi:hypothetical protein